VKPDLVIRESCGAKKARNGKGNSLARNGNKAHS
jgi:hypothetical protein